MPRPSREPPAPSSLPPALLRYVRARGGDASLLACRFDLPSDAEEKDELPVAAATLNGLLEAAATELCDPFLALRLPAELPLRRYGPAELAARSTKTLGEALACVARYAELVIPRLACALEDDVGAAALRFVQRTPAHPRGIGRAAHEYGLAYALTQVRAGTGVLVQPSSVWFAHARPSDLAPLSRFFGTFDLAFGAETSGFAIARDLLATPMLGGDARLLATAEDLARTALSAQPRGRAVAALVADRLRACLTDGADMDAVARALGMSARTLQRRLDDEGTRFSQVLDEVREERARAWLVDRALSLTEAAHRLGFADLATFSRAFKRWTGKPPGTWRRA